VNRATISPAICDRLVRSALTATGCSSGRGSGSFGIRPFQARDRLSPLAEWWRQPVFYSTSWVLWLPMVEVPTEPQELLLKVVAPLKLTWYATSWVHADVPLDPA
jgi:hypothetical protein